MLPPRSAAAGWRPQQLTAPMHAPAQNCRRWLRQGVLFALRGVSNLSKFALAIYTARYLGLADLGTYGLLVGAATIVPAAFGFGLTDWIGRHIVGLRSADAVPLVATRLTLSLFVHLVGWPLAWAANVALDTPIPASLFALIAAILFLEHLAVETEDLLILRGHIFFANTLIFVRAGLWPPVVIIWGLLDPDARTLDHLLAGWLAALFALWLVLVLKALIDGRLRLLAWRWRGLFASFRPALPFYLKDVSLVGSLHIDRFLVATFLGLELTGVYTFFWSVANVIHTLVLYGMLHNHVGEMIEAARKKTGRALAQLEHRLQVETTIWCVLLAFGAAVATWLLLPLIGRPLLQDFFWVFGVVLLATLLRIAADGYGYMLLALHRDRAIAVISTSGVVLSAILNATLIPLAGLAGAAGAYVLTSAGLLAARVVVRRSSR
jgi:O-antigen/teichoic acid export membrane protein